MRRSTIILLCLSVCSLVHAQFYSEDFSEGFDGWTVNTIECGSLASDNTGTWSLINGTYNGVDLPDFAATFTLINSQDYTASLNTLLGESYVQGRYEISADTFQSNLNGEVIPIDTNAYGAVDEITVWFTDIDLPQTLLDQGANTAFGIGNPSIDITNDTLTLTSQDGATVLTYTKSSDCAPLWLWSHNGNVGNGAFAGVNTAIDSPTDTNGVMLINNDYLVTLGDTANTPSAPFPSYISELISPVIDLSDVEGSVALRFSQLVRRFTVADNAPLVGGDRLPTSISVSTDGGATWGEAIDVNEGLPVNTEIRNSTEEVALVGVTGEAEVRIKFTYALKFYYWVLDDIAIIERVPYDLQVNENFYAIYPNLFTPISQLVATGFIADIQNNGGFPATNTELTLTIVNDMTSEVVYADTNFYGTITPDSLAENVFFDELLDPAFFDVGSYTGTYVITQDSVESVLDNDQIVWKMFVTDTLFAKENGRTRGIAPADDDSYYYGNTYYTPNGEGWFARYITFGVSNPGDLADRSVNVFLYEWDGDTNDNNLADPSEYGDAPVVFNSYTFTGSEPNQSLITIPFDLDNMAYPLKDDTYYLAMVQYITDDDQAFFLEGSEDFNYSATNFLTDSLGFEQFSAMLAVGADNNPAFSSLGFGRDIVPVVRMSIGTNPDLGGPPVISVKEVLSDDNLFQVFPNPASREINLRIELVDVSDLVEIRLFDMSGRVLHRQVHQQMQRGQFAYDVSNLANGTYLLHMVTDAGIKTQKIVVQH